MLQVSLSILFIMIVLGSSSAHALRSHAARASSAPAMKRSSTWSQTRSGNISNYMSKVCGNAWWQANSEGRQPIYIYIYIHKYIYIYTYSQARWGATSVSVHFDLTLPNVGVTKRPSNKLNQINHERIPSIYPSRDPHDDFGGFFDGNDEFKG